MSNVYFILDRDANAVKIGRSIDPEKRMADLQVGNPHRLELVFSLAGGKREEAIYHESFSHLRLHGEWYSCEAEMEEFLEERDPDSVLDIDGYNDKQIKRRFRELPDGDYEVSFGKHYGERLSEVIQHDYNYIDWIVWKSDFEECIKEFIAEQM